MPAQVTADLRQLIEGRQGSQVSVLIEGVPGEGGRLADRLSTLGIEANRLQVQNKPLFEATVTPEQVDELVPLDGLIVRIDYNGTFQPLMAAGSVQPGFSALEAEDAQRTTLYEVGQRMDVEEAWNEAGTRGQGVRVGIVDTPVDENHPALESSIAETAENAGSSTHGTWVAGAYAADDTSTPRGRIRGIAPGVDIYSYGALSGGAASAASIIEGVEWCLDHDVDIINLSLGGPHSSVLQSAVTEARQAGALPVTSAGNAGPAQGTISCPAHHDASLAVGSVSTSNEVAAFSSRGPGWTDAPRKPDVMAFGGATIVAEPDQRIVESVLGPATGGGTAYLVGTSMAAPQAGAVAALRISNQRVSGGE